MRDPRISTIRLISLIMIITCHILQGLNYELAFWFNLGVQIFFFISGYLYGNRTNTSINLREWYTKQYFKIVIPVAILVLYSAIIDRFVYNISYSKLLILGNLLGLGGFYGTLTTLSHTWFISYILICYLVTPLLQRINYTNMKEKEIAKTLLSLALLLFLFQFFGVSQINSAWIFNYILGLFFGNCYIKNKRSYKRFVITIVSISIIVLIPRLLLQYSLSLSNNILDHFKEYIFNWSHMLLGSSIFLVLYHVLGKFNLKYNRVLEFSDTNSYYIYLVHQIFILNHLSILNFTSNIFINIFLILCASIVSGLALKYLTKVIDNLLISRTQKN